MKYSIFLLPVFLYSSVMHSQSSTDSIEVITAAYGYIDGFYQGDTMKIEKYMSPKLYKYGYWIDDYNKMNGSAMSFQGAKNYANSVKTNSEYTDDNAPRKAVLLDMMSHIACVKVTAWWGFDYLLLSKQSGQWMIEQVIWQGPYED